MRAFSFGGGVQSMAVLVLQAQGKLSYDVNLFSNVGNDSENPETLDYFYKIALPYAVENKLRLEEINRKTNNGETLYQRTLREDRTIGIPVRMPNGAPGNRSCTKDFKRSVVRQWLGKGNHIVALGISWDESQRMRSDSGYKNITNEYPLIDLRLTRNDCIKVIESAGLSIPPKSSCWFCPFKKISQWQDDRQHRPELFWASVNLESLCNDKRESLGRDHVFLTSKGVPLDRAVGDQLFLLEQDDTCESGYCMT